MAVYETLFPVGEIIEKTNMNSFNDFLQEADKLLNIGEAGKISDEKLDAFFEISRFLHFFTDVVGRVRNAGA